MVRTRRNRYSGGGELQADSPRNRQDVQPDGVNGGANGAVPRDGTIRPAELRTQNAENTSLEADLQTPAESAETGRRMPWSRDMMINLMRAYYRATRNGTDMTGYRGRIPDIWREYYPAHPWEAQRLTDQVRSILRRNALSQAELNTIQKEVAEALNIIAPPVIPEEENPNAIQPNDERHSHALQPEETNGPTDQHIREVFISILMEFEGVEPQLRPKILRLPYKKEIQATINSVNKLLMEYINPTINLHEVYHLVYSAALTTNKILQISTKDRANKSQNKKDEPPWKHRLQNKINSFRTDIAYLQLYLQTPTTCKKKIKDAVKRMCKVQKLKVTSPDFLTKLKTYQEDLKQKAAALGLRIRRYNARTKKYRDNTTFNENQRRFYRSLNEGNIERAQNLPTADKMLDFWKEIWSIGIEHDDTAYWIQEELDKMENKRVMRNPEITTEDVKVAIKKAPNWKAPGRDKIQNYWWKKFTPVHESLARLFQRCLEDPTEMPSYMMEGVTYMLPKSNSPDHPKQFRPITCLPTLYKLFTNIIAKKIDAHLVDNNVMATEQNGCRRRAQGCKELLVIDAVTMQHMRNKKRNVSVAWVDYQKAFDSVPHSWLIKALQIYKISPLVVNMLQYLMSKWRTKLVVNSGNTAYETKNLPIRRGIFQGDSLSPLWFCLALNPLSSMLNSSTCHLQLERGQNAKLSHLFYMDDLKLYAPNPDKLQGLLELVANFSNSIQMKLGLDKCAVLHVKRGVVQEGQDTILFDGTQIGHLKAEETYKYLGFQEALGIRQKETKAKIMSEFVSRLNRILKTGLNSKNITTAINMWAAPVVTFTFGVLKWTKTDLESLDRKLRTTLTSNHCHHPRCSSARLYVPRESGGRGLVNLAEAHTRQIKGLRNYFQSKRLPLHETIVRIDKRLSPLDLAQDEIRDEQTESHEQQWRSKPLHGKFPANLASDDVDQEASVMIFRQGVLTAETEGTLFAIQDQVVATRAHVRHIQKINIPTDKCRLCNSQIETIQHLISGCSYLAPKDYVTRHDNLAIIIYKEILGHNKTTRPYYQYQPQPVVETEKIKVFWNHPIITDRPVAHNKPDILVINKEQKTAWIIDITIPMDENIRRSYVEKVTKYQDLRYEVKDLWQLQEVEVVPLVISAGGLVEKHFIQNLQKLKINPIVTSIAQKAVVLGTCRVVRRYLSRNM